MTDYEHYRGKCKKLSEEACKKDTSLRLVRGYYHCPMWGRQEHWWTERPDGSIYDPTKKQFPSKGIGDYEEFNRVLNCEECGSPVKEEDAIPCGNYAVCSSSCARRLVGL